MSYLSMLENQKQIRVSYEAETNQLIDEMNNIRQIYNSSDKHYLESLKNFNENYKKTKMKKNIIQNNKNSHID